MQNTPRHRFFPGLKIGLWAGILLLALAGCGVKAPPVAPEAKAPVIAQFSHMLENGRVRLVWRLAAGSPVPQYYTLYRSRTPLSEKPCRGCPLAFERFTSIPADGRSGGERAWDLEAGYHYGFKMTATDRHGLEGPDSNTIQFNH